MKANRSQAFTLVELLVVIAIIGILVALLLPAVQSAREAARRMSCVNKLKNLSLGALNYHDTRGHFPVSYGWYLDEPNDAEKHGVGWILETLPQLEEQALYDQFKQAGVYEGTYINQACLASALQGIGLASTNPDGLSGKDLVQTQLEIFQCPSDESTQQLSETQWQWQTCATATTNYKGVLGDTHANQDLPGNNPLFRNDASQFPSGVYDGGGSRDCHADTRCRGIFFRSSYLRPVKISSVTDGTSKTFMIGEDIPEYNDHSMAYYSNGDWCSCNTPLNYGVSDPDPEAFRAFWWDAQGFRSRHPGGVNFASADGSVRFVSEAVDNDLYRTSCTRNGGESVSSSF